MRVGYIAWRHIRIRILDNQKYDFLENRVQIYNLDFITGALSILWVFGQSYEVNTLRPGQNGRYFTDDIFKCIFLNDSI